MGEFGEVEFDGGVEAVDCVVAGADVFGEDVGVFFEAFYGVAEHVFDHFGHAGGFAGGEGEGDCGGFQGGVF